MSRGDRGGTGPLGPSPSQDLAVRFRKHLTARGDVADGDGVVVALSGGADSVTLLHLLRFTPGLPRLMLTAAHVDHAMRPESGDDARWVAGLCRAWDVPLVSRRLDPPARGEAQARRRRYGALEEIRGGVGARWVVTAHHADDQAETVLFRAVRGTGLAGLQGIRERRAPGIWRPLLPFTRKELRSYGAAQHMTWREDSSNLLPLPRNVLRNRVLPDLEGGVAPGAGKALAGLARRARWDEAALHGLQGEVLEAVGVRREGDGWSVDAAGMARRHPAVRARLLRELARRVGHVPGEAGTRRAVEFISSGESGASVPLGSGLTLRRELDRLVVLRDAAPPEDMEAILPDCSGGAEVARIGGACYRVTWGAASMASGPWSGSFPRDGVRFPLVVRGWRPGDRARLAYGSKKLKKLFLEARVPPAERSRIPVLADADGEVLWVPGVVRAASALPRTADQVFTIGITHAHPD